MDTEIVIIPNIIQDLKGLFILLSEGNYIGAESFLANIIEKLEGDKDMTTKREDSSYIQSDGKGNFWNAKMINSSDKNNVCLCGCKLAFDSITDGCNQITVKCEKCDFVGYRIIKGEQK